MQREDIAKIQVGDIFNIMDIYNQIGSASAPTPGNHRLPALSWVEDRSRPINREELTRSTRNKKYVVIRIAQEPEPLVDGLCAYIYAAPCEDQRCTAAGQVRFLPSYLGDFPVQGHDPEVVSVAGEVESLMSKINDLPEQAQLDMAYAILDKVEAYPHRFDVMPIPMSANRAAHALVVRKSPPPKRGLLTVLAGRLGGPRGDLVL